MIKIKCFTEEDTTNLAIKFSKLIEPGDIVCLDGDLGAGKTFFSKVLCKSLGVTEYVTSPSYTIINEYEGILPIYHFDVYRINDIDEMYELGYEEYFDSEGVCLIEWSNMIKELLPDSYYQITITVAEIFTERIFEIKGSNKILEEKLEDLNI